MNIFNLLFKKRISKKFSPVVQLEREESLVSFFKKLKQDGRLVIDRSSRRGYVRFLKLEDTHLKDITSYVTHVFGYKKIDGRYVRLNDVQDLLLEI